VYGPSAGFETLQPFEMQYGRYFSASELEKGSPIAVIGYTNAEVLFGKPKKTIGQKTKIKRNFSRLPSQNNFIILKRKDTISGSQQRFMKQIKYCLATKLGC